MIVITGATGFIGSVLVGYLNQQNVYDIVCVDKMRSESKWKNLLGKSFSDVIDPDDLFAFLNENAPDVQVIIHLGACTKTTEEDTDFLLHNNYRYSQNIYNWCLAHDVRLIYASSASTYGDGGKGFSDDEFDLYPLNKYGYSKHLFDIWQQKRPPLKQCVGLKFFNVYGPNEYHKTEMCSVILNLYNEILSKDRVKIFGSDGAQKRDFVYVLDVARVIHFFMQNQEQNGIFNVGSGQASDFNAISRVIFQQLGLQENIEYISLPKNLEKTYQWFTQADIKKLRKAGCTEPFLSVEEGIEDYIDRYLKHSKYY